MAEGMLAPAKEPKAAAPADKAQPAPLDDDEEEQGEPASPEEQALYEQVVTQAYRLIYTPEGKVNDATLGRLAGEGGQAAPAQGGAASAPPPAGGQGEAAKPEGLPEANGPVDHLANTAAIITKKVADSARENRIEIPPDVLMAAGREILEELATVAEAGGVHDYSQEEMNAAWLRGLDIFREMGMADGTIDGEALKGEFQQIVEADAQGQLDALLPGLSGAAKRLAGGVPGTGDVPGDGDRDEGE